MDGGSGSIDKLCLTLATPWTVGFQAPLSMGFSRQEYWSGLPFSSPGDLPDPGIKLRSPASQADSLLTESPGKPQNILIIYSKLNIVCNLLLMESYFSELGHFLGLMAFHFISFSDSASIIYSMPFFSSP